MKESAYAAVLGWKNALNVDPRVKQQADRSRTRTTTRIPTPKPIPRARAEDARGVRHLHQLHQGPEGRRARRDEVPQGEHLSPLQPLRRGDPDLHGHPRSPPRSTRPPSTRRTSCSIPTTGWQKFDEMLALVDKLDGDKKFLEGKDDLKATLGKIKAQSMRKRAREAREEGEGDARTSRKYVACGQALPRHLQPQPGSHRERRGALQRRRLLRGGQVDRRRDRDVQHAARSTTRSRSITAKAVARLGKAYGDIAFYDRAVGQARGVREEVRRREGRVRRDERRGVLPQGHRRRRTRRSTTPSTSSSTFGSKNAEGGRERELLADLDLREAEATSDAVIKHLREYIHKFGEQGWRRSRRDRVRQDRRRSCGSSRARSSRVDGSCVKITRERAIEPEEGREEEEGRHDQPDAVRPGVEDQADRRQRDDRKMHEALDGFKAAEKRVREGKRQDRRRRGRRALLLRASPSSPRPTSTSRSTSTSSSRRTSTSTGSGAQGDQGEEPQAVQRLGRRRRPEGRRRGDVEVRQACSTIKDAANSIAAAARLGQISQNFSDALFTAEIPKDVAHRRVRPRTTRSRRSATR